jgi:hypothetical protein
LKTTARIKPTYRLVQLTSEELSRGMVTFSHADPQNTLAQVITKGDTARGNTYVPYGQNLSNHSGKILTWYNTKSYFYHCPRHSKCSQASQEQPGSKSSKSQTRFHVHVVPYILVRYVALLKNM